MTIRDDVMLAPSSSLSLHKKTGLSLLTASVFIVGEMAGSGILSLPNALANAGWFGIALIIMVCIISAHASIYLAECWCMVEEKWPEYKENTRDPFATIGAKAVGPWMGNLCSLLMDIQLFGVGVVFLILCSLLIKDLVDSLLPELFHLNMCTWIIIIGLLLIPLSWCGSPIDFTPIAYGAMSCTAISCVFVLVIFVLEGEQFYPNAEYRAPSFSSLSLSFGTILFAFGGACTFPTFQNDMQDKSKFSSAIYLGFAALLLLYIPIAATGYAIFGFNAQPNILHNVNESVFHKIINSLMAFHVFCAYLICVNPLNLDLEKRLKISHGFNSKRCSFRTLIGLAIIFVALSVPSFGNILNLVGGSTVTILTYIFPPLFYVNLCQMHSEKSPSRKISSLKKVYLVLMVLVGLIGGVAATYFAIIDIMKPDSLTLPCYFCWK